MTINTSTRARITRGIFNAVTARLLPAVVRLHYKSLLRIQDQQDRDLAQARAAAMTARRVFLESRDRADAVAEQRVGVLIALAEERQRINTYVKED